MLNLDATVFVQIVDFIVFLAIMNVIFFRPVGAAIARRRAYIDGLKHDIEETPARSACLARDGRGAPRRGTA